MKKKLEADLISIAHRILKLKNKSELAQLHQEAQKLYETLTVLRFVETNFSDVKPTIGLAEIQEKIADVYETETENEVAEPEPVAELSEKIQEEITNDEEPLEEEVIALTDQNEEVEAKDAEEMEEPVEVLEKETSASEEKQEEVIAAEELSFKPAFELSFDSKEEIHDVEASQEEPKSTSPQITFDDLLGSNYVDPVFVKPEDLAQEKESAASKNVIPIGRSYSDSAPVISISKDNDFRSVSLNDRLSKGITIGLNDRIAFMKNLFANSSEDYNRVLSQLMTFDSFQEAQDFIDNMVKPDYNNWEGKDEYSQRFMEIVEKKFS